MISTRPFSKEGPQTAAAIETYRGSYCKRNENLKQTPLCVYQAIDLWWRSMMKNNPVSPSSKQSLQQLEHKPAWQ